MAYFTDNDSVVDAFLQLNSANGGRLKTDGQSLFSFDLRLTAEFGLSVIIRNRLFQFEFSQSVIQQAQQPWNVCQLIPWEKKLYGYRFRLVGAFLLRI